MTKPVIVTRIGKGSELTFQEGDANFTNLRDAAITVSDGTTSTAIDLNGTITFAAGSGIDVDETTGTITISNTQSAGIASVVQDTAPMLGGELNVNGFAITSSVDTNIVLTPGGNGYIVLDGLEWPPAPTTAAPPGGTAGTTGNLIEISNNRFFLSNFAGIGIGPMYTQQIQFTGPGVATLGLSDQIMYYIVDADDNTSTIQISDESNTGSVLNVNNAAAISDVTFSVFEQSAPPSASGGTVTRTDASNFIFLTSMMDVYMGQFITFTGTGVTALGLNSDQAYYISFASNENNNIQISSTMGMPPIDVNTVDPVTDVSYTISGSSPPSGGAGGSSVLTLDSATGVLNWVTPAAPPSPGISSVQQDFDPRLGGNLDVMGFSIVSQFDGNIVLAPSGNGRTVANRLNYNEAVHDLGTASGTITPDVANGNVQTVTLNGNLTLNAFTSPVAGQSVTLIVNTGGAGRTLTSSMLFAGGDKTLSETDTTDIISVFFDGTNYWASLSKDFN